MLKSPRLLAAGLVIGALAVATDARAAGRQWMGGHPYHNGYYYIPPSSAYEAVRVRPPLRYGVPAYYFPASYLAPGYSYYPPASYPGGYYAPTWYRGVPAEVAAGYYMSDAGPAFFYPWHRPAPPVPGFGY